MADSHSRVFSIKLCLLGLPPISIRIIEEIKATWSNDKALQALKHDLQQDPTSHPYYQWIKWSMVVGNNPSLHMKLISLKHDTGMEGSFGHCVTNKRVRAIFY